MGCVSVVAWLLNRGRARKKEKKELGIFAGIICALDDFVRLVRSLTVHTRRYLFFHILTNILLLSSAAVSSGIAEQQSPLCGSKEVLAN